MLTQLSAHGLLSSLKVMCCENDFGILDIIQCVFVVVVFLPTIIVLVPLITVLLWRSCGAGRCQHVWLSGLNRWREQQ